MHTFVERSAKSVEDDINALTRIPNSMLRKMRVVPLSKSAEYVQAHTADGDENGCPTLLPPLILTDTGLKDKKQLFSFEGLRESCGLIPIMKPFGRKSSAAAEEDEGIMAVD